jgi:hypothetical protein
MKVLILGAAGRAAKAVISFLPSLGHIERLYLADHNAEALCKMAVDLRHLPVSPRYLDAENERSLYERIAEAEVVLGCLGPFHLYESSVARAVIAAGRDYLSLCDDPAALQEVMSLGGEAKRKGVRVLCGCGLTPGLSNLLACRANAALDGAEAVEIAWFLDMGSDLGPATLEHLLRSFSGKAPAYGGGSVVKNRAASWEETVEFPPPAGWQTVSHLGHPEPVTLPGTLMGVRDIWFKAGVGDKGKSLALHTLAWIGEGSGTELRRMVLLAAARGIARHGKRESFTSLRVAARGSRGGIGSNKVFSVSGEYYHLSALVLAAAAGDMLEAAWAPGVYTAEDILDRRPFFTRLYRAGLRIFDGEKRP